MSQLYLHIEKGCYEDTVFFTPGNMFNGPIMKIAFYLDKNANQELADALTEIFSCQPGGEVWWREY